MARFSITYLYNRRSMWKETFEIAKKNKYTKHD